MDLPVGLPSVGTAFGLVEGPRRSEPGPGGFEGEPRTEAVAVLVRAAAEEEAAVVARAEAVFVGSVGAVGGRRTPG